MVELALSLGIFSLLIFAFGLLGLASKTNLLFLGLLFLISQVFLLAKKKSDHFSSIKKFFNEIKKNNFSKLLFALLFFSALVNLIGAIGPELGFDALWYHLTIPKIYLSFEKIFYLPGNLFYYSALPKLTEMFYLFSLTVSPWGILAKIIHYLFGILISMVLFKMARRFLNVQFSLLAVLIFYSTLIVGWLSTTAYVDLARTFFELLSLNLFLDWWIKVKEKNNYNETSKTKIILIESALIFGLAISTKLLAIGLLPVFLVLIFWRTKKLKDSFYFLFFSILVLFPWLIFSYLNTGNFIYPIFAGVLDQSHKFVWPNPLRMVKDCWQLFFRPQDLISPVFLIFLPVVLLRLRKIIKEKPADTDNQLIKVLLVYLAGAILAWYLTPRTGGGRFFLPYLPVFSLLTVVFCSQKNDFVKKTLIYVSVFVAIFNLGYRFLANKKYLPVLLGLQTRQEFLLSNLNFSNSDFLDPNQEIKNIVKDDVVLVFGSHNLFYADFGFVHESYAPKGRYYAYILTQNSEYPEKMGNLKLIYENSRTRVNLYLFGQVFQ